MSAVNLFTESSISATNLFNKHAYQQSTYQQVTEGGRRQGRSLKIRRTPAGGAGRVQIEAQTLRSDSADSEATGTPPLPPAPPKSNPKSDLKSDPEKETQK